MAVAPQEIMQAIRSEQVYNELLAGIQTLTSDPSFPLTRKMLSEVIVEIQNGWIFCEFPQKEVRYAKPQHTSIVAESWTTTCWRLVRVRPSTVLTDMHTERVVRAVTATRFDRGTLLWRPIAPIAPQAALPDAWVAVQSYELDIPCECEDQGNRHRNFYCMMATVTGRGTQVETVTWFVYYLV